MAYDLIARLKLVDNLSQPIRRAIGNMRGMKTETDAVSRSIHESNKATNLWRDSNGKLRDEMGRFASTGNRYSGTFDKMGASVSGLRGNISGLHSSLIGLAGAYAAVEGGRKLFDATVASAARTEMEQAVITALFNNTKKADEWFNYVEQRAKDSALFSMDDFLKSSKAYIPMTKDLGQLRQLTALTERLAASNPMQGMEGASFSIREMMSGDAQSLVERFNLPRKWVNEIKGKSGQEFIDAMDRLLNRMGFTDKFLADISDTGIAKYNQLAEKIRLAFKDMGVEGLERAKPILDRIDGMLEDGKFKGIQDFGSEMIVKAMEATERAVVSFDKFMTRIQSDEEWKKMSIGDKLIRLTEEGMDSLNEWLANGGSDKISKSIKPIAETALGIGAAVGKGILDGFIDYAKENPLSGAIIGGLVAMKIAGGPTLLAAASSGTAIGVALASAAAIAITAGLVEAVNKAMEYVEKRNEERGNLQSTPLGRGYNRELDTPDDQPMYQSGNMTPYEPTLWDKTKNWFSNAFSNYNGIDSVPYDGYKAILHKGEKVVPSTEVGKGNGNITIAKLADQIIVREEADIDRIGEAIVRKLEEAGANMAT
ncbi:hypothetical protein [Aneurinibacillus migulanus]|uniref:hypothetical protein n=1 Tax=Aneurinibacillus migulanus TaxID=47500 RepID=UPI00209F14BB|nr:hypothetical protein [Aneurinibacillus migulanus]MCP1354667.1 hypothetical protein [Aneurinibacillus migulanus]